MRLKNLKIKKYLSADFKNFFQIFWVSLYLVHKKLDRPIEPQKVKNTKVGEAT